MKLLYAICAAAILLLPACETARHATADAGYAAGRTLEKTGSVVTHGGEKLANATQ